MNDKEFLEKLKNTRYEINNLIDDLVKEVLKAFPNYAEAITAIRQGKFLLWGNVGQLIIEEAIEKNQNKALKKPTK